MNNIKKFLSKKLITTTILMIIQVLIFIYVFIYMQKHAFLLWVSTTIFAVMLYLAIVVSDENSTFKISWITLLFITPFFALTIYLTGHADKLSIKLKRSMNRARNLGLKNIGENSIEYSDDEEYNNHIPSSFHTEYLTKYGFYPAYDRTTVEYFPLGEDMFEEILNQLRTAKKFIFLEYFIISEGYMFSKIFEILKEKIKEGVEVRIMYDDLGTLGVISEDFKQNLEKSGIKVQVFNPLGSFFSLSLNNRNHRKIAVIDSAVGFTGGINIGDEYINRTHPHGHWKDTAIMLKGDAVWSLCVMFLSMWNALAESDEDFTVYKPIENHNCNSEIVIEKDCIDTQNKFVRRNGLHQFVQPYFDNSIDNESLVENIYISIISRAEKYVYITSPYLVPTDEINKALKIAAKSGVDVRIVVPFVQDKRYIKFVNQSYYQELIRAGVKIYEYTPGFIHAKMVVCDDLIASVGTANFDFRSFFLNMECGCYLYNLEVICEIREDIENVMKCSKVFSLEDDFEIGLIKRIVQALLRTFAPLM